MKIGQFVTIYTDGVDFEPCGEPRKGYFNAYGLPRRNYALPNYTGLARNILLTMDAPICYEEDIRFNAYLTLGPVAYNRRMWRLELSPDATDEIAYGIRAKLASMIGYIKLYDEEEDIENHKSTILATEFQPIDVPATMSFAEYLKESEDISVDIPAEINAEITRTRIGEIFCWSFKHNGVEYEIYPAGVMVIYFADYDYLIFNDKHVTTWNETSSNITGVLAEYGVDFIDRLFTERVRLILKWISDEIAHAKWVAEQ